MTLDDIKKTICEEAGISQAQNESLINRRINLALEALDGVVEWNFAMKEYSKTIPANSNSVSVGTDLIFKPISCSITIGDDKYSLNYIVLSDLERITAAYGDDTNDYPQYYSVGGNKLYVGAGLLGSSAVVEGKYQRKLTINDIQYLPGDLVIDRVLMKMLKKGEKAQIAAWNGWNVGTKRIQETYKVTVEKRSYSAIDEQVLINMAYLDSLDE